jgi:hypothetical protein
MSTSSLLFSVVDSKDLECHSVNIKNALIRGHLEEHIYMQQPSGFHDGTGAVLLLHKSVYGLKSQSVAPNSHCMLV